MSAISLDERGVLVTCRQCGRRNRLAYEHLGQTFRCAQCQADLELVDETVEVGSEASFSALTGRSALPVLVDYWAAWCGPCKMLAPELGKAAREGRGRWVIAKVDTEKLPELAARFQVSALPTVALFHEGREVARQPGVLSAAAIRRFIEQHAVQHEQESISSRR